MGGVRIGDNKVEEMCWWVRCASFPTHASPSPQECRVMVSLWRSPVCVELRRGAQSPLWVHTSQCLERSKIQV